MVLNIWLTIGSLPATCSRYCYPLMFMNVSWKVRYLYGVCQYNFALFFVSISTMGQIVSKNGGQSARKSGKKKSFLIRRGES